MASSQPPRFDNFHSAVNVQELAKGPMILVPQQYVRSDKAIPTSLKPAPVTPLPIIDLNLLVSEETTDLELKQLHSTCKEWGFFQLVNHGISSSLLDKLKYDIEEFYKLSLEERMIYKLRQGEFEGYGALARAEGKFDWSDRLNMIINPTHRRKPHLFPELPSSLRNTLECYLLEVQKLAMKLLGFIAKTLKIDLKEMEEMFDDGMQSVAMAYYPPCPKPELVIGITPHSDATGITILNQVNGVDGLQVKKDGVWIPVNFLPHALVVNVGDVLEIFSNGIYKSIEHTVSVSSEKERISIAYFVNPKFEAEVGPATSLINPQNPPMYKKVGMEQYLKDFLSRPLYRKSYVEQMKIENEGGNTA